MDVASFTIDHDRLPRGIFVSRYDQVGDETVTTFDIRMKLSNIEPVLGNAEIHTMEHLMAVYLRGPKSGWADRVIYIGPMGCRTGLYFIVKGRLSSQEILPLVKNMFAFIRDFDDPVPATTSKECGNYLDHNLAFARFEAEKYLREVLEQMKPENLNYPS